MLWQSLLVISRHRMCTELLTWMTLNTGKQANESTSLWPPYEYLNLVWGSWAVFSGSQIVGAVAKWGDMVSRECSALYHLLSRGAILLKSAEAHCLHGPEARGAQDVRRPQPGPGEGSALVLWAEMFQGVLSVSVEKQHSRCLTFISENSTGDFSAKWIFIQRGNKGRMWKEADISLKYAKNCFKIIKETVSPGTLECKIGGRSNNDK